MSKRIDLLLEKFLTAYDSYAGYHEIFVNPTKREMKDIMDKHKNLRFIADKKKKNVYVFPVDAFHARTWNDYISKETNDSRKMYGDGTLFGGALENGQVENWGFRDRLYKPEILAEWVLNPEEWKFAQKWFDVMGWIEDQKDSLEYEGAM